MVTGYRHAERCDCPSPQGHCACGCIKPTPDPTSPCGFLNEYMRQRAYLPCNLPDGGLSHTHDDIFGPHRESAGCHTHVPTRCTCGDGLVME